MSRNQPLTILERPLEPSAEEEAEGPAAVFLISADI